jgi:carotenoid cleavage dioxygenase-like enzyme
VTAQQSHDGLRRSDGIDLNHTQDRIFRTANGPFPTRFTLSLASGAVRQEPLTDSRPYEFPVVPLVATGRRCRYAYAAAFRGGGVAGADCDTVFGE